MNPAALPILNPPTAPHNNTNKIKSYKGKTVPERVAWMARTSDVFGSYHKTDLDSYLTLIRRKVQEKCTTTVDLMTMIRRFKVTESHAVTPNEFRHTLIKFGIILAQPLVDRIFYVFDSDRSGTMDFDEFATWIMNSEFRPKVKEVVAPTHPESPVEILRQKFLSCVQEHAKVFDNMNKQVSFQEFISDVNRKSMRLTEKEARSIFQILDPHDSGFVASAALVRWAETGKADYKDAFVRPPEIQANSMEELCNKVVGRNTKALENAFSHVQKGSGTRLPFEEFRRCLLNAGVGKNIYDVHQLFQALGGATTGSADIDVFFNHLSPIYVDPRTEISNKNVATSIMSIGRADRHLRDAIRKSFKVVKQEIMDKDLAGNGFIQPDELYQILVKRCTPLTFQDFRFLTQQMKKGSGGIDYHHFLQTYNPSHTRHELDGSTLSRSSSLFPSTTTLPNTSSNNTSTLTSTLSKTTSIGKLTKSLPRNVGAVDDISVGTVSYAKKPQGDLKRIWHVVLKECHRADPDRSGQISRSIFISALQKADSGKLMSPEAMNKLADEYTLSNGLINYLYCFRNYLSDITGMDNTGFSSSADFGNTSGGQETLQSTTVDSQTQGHLEITPAERDALLAKYNEQVLSICSKVYKVINPVWRQVRTQLKKRQVVNSRGVILAVNFISILEDNGVILDKKDIGILVKVFRGPGMQDVIKFDEFLRESKKYC